MIRFWLTHYRNMIAKKLREKMDSDLQLITDFIEATDKRRKENNMSMEDLLLTAITLRNLKTVYDEPETCPDCGGRKTVLGHTKDDMWRYSQCEDCGLIYETPIENGVVMTSKETVIDDA